MPRLTLAPNLARWLDPSATQPAQTLTLELPGAIVRDVLEHFFALHPPLRSYILDDQNALRHHVIAFVNNVAVADKTSLNEPVPPDGEIYLFQALSGG